MLSITEIEREFPDKLRGFKRNILKEYLQYQILNIIFSTSEGQKLCFIGGTALRIIHGLPRFSEDLDFDTSGLTAIEFEKIGNQVKSGLEKEGYEVEISFSGQSAFRCNIRLPQLLFKQGLSPYPNEKILIQIDTENQGTPFEPETIFINKFGIFRPILATRIDTLLSQKIITAFNRKRAKGRDFYDILFLIGKTRPDYSFLYAKKKIENFEQLICFITQELKKIKFETLTKDLESFVFEPQDALRIMSFPNYIQTLSKIELGNNEDYLYTQAFQYDKEQEHFYHSQKKIIMTKEWVKSAIPNQLDEATIITHDKLKKFST